MMGCRERKAREASQRRKKKEERRLAGGTPAPVMKEGENLKAVLMSIQPEWCKLIGDGKKTVEVRKRKPKLATPFKVYIYCTKDGDTKGTVIGEFVCDRIEEWDSEYWNDNSVYQAISRIDYDDEGDYEWVNVSSNEDDNPSDNYLCKESCLSFEEIQRYAGNGRFYAWHISDLVIYSKPKELSEFFTEDKRTYDYPQLKALKRPPQSWCYVAD